VASLTSKGGSGVNDFFVVLGVIGVRRGDQMVDVGGPRQRRLLGALLLERGRCVSAERLVDIVWSGDPPAQARNSLRTYIARLRRVLEVNGSQPVLTEPTGWRLDVTGNVVDSDRFESGLEAAQAMAADPVGALDALDEALKLWRGDAYVEFADEEWFVGEAVRLNELRLVAHEDRFEAMLGCGLHDDVIGDVARFIEANSLRERPRAQQMTALYKAGRQVEALRAFQDYRRLLGNEVGVEPSRDLRKLEQRIVTRDPDLDISTPAGRALRGYRLGRRIGEGQFGVVYRASQPAIGREVAVKVVRSELADDADFIRRFEREAQTVAGLDHPHVVPLFDYWREPGGAYLVMRYLRGGSLADLLQSGQPQPVGFASQLVEQIGGALVAAHDAGVVHCDVRPENILFDEHRNAYLADFGISRRAGDPDEADLVLSSSIYVGPEGVTNGPAKPSTDIYAFGAALYAVLAGEAPFDSTTPSSVLNQVKASGPIGPLSAVRPDLPDDLDAVIERATAPDPARRYGSVTELVLAFRAATGAAGTTDAVAPNIFAPVPISPYKGLTAFDEADSRDFFGRSALIEQIHEAVRSSRFVTIVGASGSGKSSVIRAGVAPLLRAEGSFVVSMTPGRAPLAALESALLTISTRRLADRPDLDHSDVRSVLEMVEWCVPHDADDVVLIVDQFEELFTQTPDGERDLFLDALVDVATAERGRLRVVATLRADFYDRPLGHFTASTLMRDATIAVTALSAEELEQTIVEPARQVGVDVEPSLTAALIGDAISDPASLPMLQFALTSMFESSDHRVLTLAGYRRLGGIAGAVARRADELYEQASDDERAGLRRLFTRLAGQELGGPVTRRRALRSELTEISDEVIERYADARLLSIDRDVETREPTVEVAHESLVNHWPRFRSWLDDDQDGLRIMRHLSRTAEAWSRDGRSDDELYRGARLDAAEEWVESNPGDVNELEQSFMDTSLEALEDARRHDLDQRDREVRSNRRLRWLATALSIVVVFALVAAGAAFLAGERADDTAAEADFQRLTAVSSSLVESDRRLAMLVAVEAFDRTDDVESRGALKTALMTEPRFLARSDSPPLIGRGATVASDGSWIFASRVATNSEATEGTWYNTATFEAIGHVRVDERWRLVSSLDRSLVAAIWLTPPGVEDSANDERIRQVRVHDDDGNLVKVIETTEPPTYVGFDGRGRVVVAEPRAVSLHQLGSDEPAIVIDVDLDAPIVAGDIDSGSSLFAAATLAGETVLVDLDDGDLVDATPPSDRRCEREVCSVAFSQDGSRVAFGVASGAIGIRDTNSWEIVREFDGLGRAVSAIAFVNDGTLLAGYIDGVISQWDLGTGTRSADDLDSQTTDVSALVVLDDERFATMSLQGNLQRWTSDNAGPFATRLGAGLGFTAIAPDGKRGVRTNTPEVGMVTVYDLDSPTPVSVFTHPASTLLGHAAFSADGRRLAVATITGEIELFDTSSFDPIGSRLEGRGFGPLAFSPDGRHIAVGWNLPGASKLTFDAFVWTIESGRIVDIELSTDFENVTSVAWRPDGAAVTFADRGGDGTFDIETGKQIGARFSVRGQGQAMGIAWEPDSAHLLGAGPFGVSRWDASNGTRITPIDRESPSEWLALAADANVLATLGTDGRLWTWDLGTGAPLGAPIPDQRLGELFGLLPPQPVISSDGSHLALDGDTGTILWNLEPQRWSEIACEIAGRNMTRDEWARTVGRAQYRATCAQWPVEAE
jgi:serine/threonine protein kinase/WD40 repeat protein/DNA-binding winged helix-turn-helix (wHTH) protein